MCNTGCSCASSQVGNVLVFPTTSTRTMAFCQVVVLLSVHPTYLLETDEINRSNLSTPSIPTHSESLVGRYPMVVCAVVVVTCTMHPSFYISTTRHPDHKSDDAISSSWCSDHKDLMLIHCNYNPHASFSGKAKSIGTILSIMYTNVNAKLCNKFHRGNKIKPNCESPLLVKKKIILGFHVPKAQSEALG